jgi:hypothetical protein
MDPEVAELIARIPTDQIPYVVASLLVRLLAECNAGCNGDRAGSSDSDKLLTPRQLAERLGVPRELGQERGARKADS